MNITPVSVNPAFGKLFIGKPITRRLQSSDCSNSFSYEYDHIESLLTMMGADSMDNVDIILNYSPKKNFYGVISSKKFGVPKSPAFMCKISTKINDIGIFTRWLNMWDTVFAPSNCKNSKQAIETVKTIGAKKLL